MRGPGKRHLAGTEETDAQGVVQDPASQGPAAPPRGSRLRRRGCISASATRSATRRSNRPCATGRAGPARSTPAAAARPSAGAAPPPSSAPCAACPPRRPPPSPTRNDRRPSMLDSVQATVDTALEDDAAKGVFRVARDIFTDPALFELEMRHIFEGNWIYLAHESQIPNNNDYFTTSMGRQPIFIARNRQGELNAFINACSHR